MKVVRECWYCEGANDVVNCPRDNVHSRFFVVAPQVVAPHMVAFRDLVRDLEGRPCN
jgi:hypothetical protein